MYIEFIEGAKHAYKDADISDSHEHFKDAGYILQENEVVVDVDNVPKDVLNKIINTFGIKTHTVWTDRGVHFYFNKPPGFRGAKKVCPLGFEVEYKHAVNTKAITVKRDGKMREVVNEGIRQDLPDILYSRKRLVSLLGMEEGEGRNNALFSHRMAIGTLKNWKSIIQFINNNIFATPMEDTEVESLLRDVAIEATKDNEPAVADYFMGKYNVVSYLDELHFNDNGIYNSNLKDMREAVFSEVPGQKTRYVDEIIKQMEYRAVKIPDNTTFDIKFHNGILRDGYFIEADYKEFTPYSIDIDYDPNAAPVQEVDDYMDHLTDHDKDYRARLEEVLAHPLIVDKEFKRMMGKFFIFVGDGGNGKGTLLSIIRHILNDKNCTGLSIDDMSDERYFTTMQDTLANLGDDIQDMAIDHKQMKHLKNISTCDFVSTRQLYKQSREVELTTTLIFTSNHILKSFEKGESYKRRVDWLPMYGKPKSKDSKFITKLTTEAALRYWVRLLVEGYQRLYTNEQFTDSEKVSKFNSDYHDDNNSVLSYIQDYGADHFIGKRSPEAHDEYEVWAEENGLNVQSRKLFTNSILDAYDLEIKNKRIGGKTARVFSLIEE